MLNYFIKRILSVIPVLLVVSFTVFLIIHLTPGDPATSILGMEATEEEIRLLRESMGLNDPFFTQYFKWGSGVLKGDLGESYFMKESVAEAIREHFVPTLSLALLAQFFSLLISLPIGIYAAYRNGFFTERCLMLLSLIGLALPSFVLSLLLLILFAVVLKILPVAGYAPISQGLGKHLYFLFLPALSLAIGQAAFVSRITRSAMLDVLEKDYIQTAKMKGLSTVAILFSQGFKNALLPIITVVGQSFGSLVAGAVVVETVFNIPGLGQLLINSIQRRDLILIQGIVLTISVIYVLINLAVDLSYGLIDPRINLSEKKGGRK